MFRIGLTVPAVVSHTGQALAHLDDSDSDQGLHPPMNTALSPRKAPRQSRAAVIVTAVLGATVRILPERGYAATSTNAVAERAGVSVGSLYQYFPNKDALIAALHRVLEPQPAGLDVVVAPLRRHRDKLAVTDLRLAAFVLNHGKHALIHTIVPTRPRGVSLKAATAEIVRMMRAYLIAPTAAT